jgi:hypothetical protein
MTGNKGEWSELYTFLKLLADGRLYAADAMLQRIPEVYYPIIEIIRKEGAQLHRYATGNAVKVIDAATATEVLNVPVAEFAQEANLLFSKIKHATGRSFAIPAIEPFLEQIKVNSLTAARREKRDINIVVHDLNTGLKPLLGFSIKSLLGKNATLFNAGNTTNFIYKLVGRNAPLIDVQAMNNIVTEPKIASRIAAITNEGCDLMFVDIESKTLKLNLQLIDSRLPELIAALLFLKYTSNGSAKMTELVAKLAALNPLGFDLQHGHPFYEHKIKNFLTDSALGMTPSVPWAGHYDATGGIIVVKEDGDLVCYHIYNRSEFQEYLLNNTRLEQASTTRYQFGEVYMVDGEMYIKLNLQIRFD